MQDPPEASPTNIQILLDIILYLCWFFHGLDGVLYAATVNNFLGTQPIISRATGSPAGLIRTDTSVEWLNGELVAAGSSWRADEASPRAEPRADGSPSLPPFLPEPEFVASAFIRESRHGDNDKIYFFFTETAREYDFYEKVKVPRVARVCKVGRTCQGVLWDRVRLLPGG